VSIAGQSVAHSGDLAYTYGTCSLGEPAAAPLWYVHLWARAAAGDRRIVVAALLP
jgi:hypothetical protein